MSIDLYNFVVGPLLGWLVAVTLGFMGYLLSLEIKDLRRQRRMDAERERLGLRRA